jgi:Na+/melibiose symporter-like transporter
MVWPSRQVAIYGGAHFGKSLIWQASDALLLYFWTDIARLPDGWAGPLFAVSLVASGLLDIAVGVIADRRARRDGGLGIYFLLGAPISAFFFSCSFVAPPFGQTGGLIYALGISILFRVAYAFIDVPENALLVRLNCTRQELLNLSAGRTIASAAASLVVAGCALVLFDHVASNSGQGAFTLAAALGGLVAIPLLLGCLKLTPEAGREAALPDSAPRSSSTNVAILANALAATTLASGFSKGLVYMGTDVLGDPGWVGHAFLVMTIGKLLGAWLWADMAARFPSLWTALFAIFGTLLLIVADLLCAHFFRPLLDGMTLIVGAALGGLNVIAWASLAKLNLFDSRQRNKDVAAFTLLSKIGTGFGGFLSVAAR